MYPFACFSLDYVAFARFGVFLTNLGQVSRPFLTSSAKLKRCSRWPKNDSMLKCRIRSKPIGKLTFLDTCWRPNLVQFGAGNSHLNWFCLGSILAEATPSIFSKMWCFCRKFKYNGDVWNTLFISSGSFSKSDLGAQNPCLERSKSLQNPSFWTENDTKFESAVSWRRTHVILPFQRKNTENTEDYAALQSAKTGTNSATPTQNVGFQWLLVERFLFAWLNV